MSTYALTPVQASCPACRSEEAELLYAVDSEGAAQHYVLREVQPERHEALRRHIERLWRGSACRLLQCRQCGFGYADPYVAGDADFYNLAYTRSSGYPAWKWEFGATLRSLRQTVPPDAWSRLRLLEVGAGDGAFVKRLTPALMPSAHVLCTEFSDYGRASIERAGIRCLPLDVRALDGETAGGPFDVVCLFQVVEHMDGLDQLFEHLFALTGAQASVYISVPSKGRVEFNERNGIMLDMPPNHIGRWTKAAFEAVAARTGWRVADYELERDSPATRAKQLVMYRYMRVRAERGSIANRIEQVQAWRLKRGMQAVAAAVYGLAKAPTLLRLVTGADLGDSQWVHLKKN